MAAAMTSAAALCAVLALAGGAAAQTDDYYLFSDGPDDAWILQGGGISSTFSHQANDLAIAISDTIRALQWDGDGSGLEYDLNGIPTGNSYPFPVGVLPQLLDGTTDGVSHNYAGEWGSDILNRVWRFDRDWANPELLFTAQDDVTGITYDGTTDTLWLSLNEGGDIQNVDFDGNVISSFNPGPGRWGALAWEPSTNTLWTVNNLDSEMRQYATDGTLLTSQFVIGFGNVWGGEFAIIPAPGALALLGLAGLMGTRRRRS